MGVAHVGLVHCDPCECKVKDFPAVSSIEKNESKRRHLQGVRHFGYVFVVVVLEIMSFDFSIHYNVGLVDNSIGKGMCYIIWLLYLYLFWYKYGVWRVMF